MDIATTEVGDIHILAPKGSIDTRSSTDLERKVDELFQKGTRLYVFDLAGVEVITSAGIRVLLKLTKLLGGSGLALCSLNEQVATVLDIAGFSGFFTIEADRASATRRIQQQGSPPKPKEATSVTKTRSRVDVLAELMMGDKDSKKKPHDPTSTTTTTTRASKKLSSHLERLLSMDDES
jgi:anti-anti-sigma factor